MVVLYIVTEKEWWEPFFFERLVLTNYTVKCSMKKYIAKVRKYNIKCSRQILEVYMFTVFTREFCSELIESQLNTIKKERINNWGFPCLFFDDKFNNFFSNKYMQLNIISGYHFHVFSFANPPQDLINNRLMMLNEKCKDNENNQKIFESLRDELIEMKQRPAYNNCDLRRERDRIRKQIIDAYQTELDYSDEMDIIIFDMNAIHESSQFIDAYIINTDFDERDDENMLNFIVKLSRFSKEVFLDDQDHKFERILNRLNKEKINMKHIKIRGDLLKFFQNTCKC